MSHSPPNPSSTPPPKKAPPTSSKTTPPNSLSQKPTEDFPAFCPCCNYPLAASGSESGKTHQETTTAHRCNHPLSGPVTDESPSLASTSGGELCPACNAELFAPIWQESRPAWLGIRFLPALIDFLLASLASSLAGFLLMTLGVPESTPLRPAFVAHLLVQGGVFFAYFFLFTWRWSTTPGKRLFRLRLVHQRTGEPLTVTQAFLREVPGRFLRLLLSPLGYLTIFFPSSRARTLSDYLTRTVVIRPPPK